MTIPTSDEIKRRREFNYHRTPKRRLHTVKDAQIFVEEVGFCHFWPIKGVETPNLFHAIAGRVRPVPMEHADPDGVRLDEAEAAVVAQMFEWYLEPGVTLYHVAKRLTGLELPTPAGKFRWSVSTVRSILTNDAYTGVAYANRLRVVPSKRHLSALRPVGKGESTVERPQEEWIPIPVPAVVAQEVFDQVQAKLSLNQQKAPRNNKAHPYLLRGLVSCGMCRLECPRAHTA